MYSFPLNGPISSAPRNLEVLDAQLSGNDSGRLLANHQGGTVGVGTHILRTDGNLKREGRGFINIPGKKKRANKGRKCY